eukprot:14720577-Alexandrium_andersonii.AAC.1
MRARPRRGRVGRVPRHPSSVGTGPERGRPSEAHIGGVLKARDIDHAVLATEVGAPLGREVLPRRG